MRLIEKEVTGTYPNAVAVWFNAWQYEKEEHLIVPLVATINKELEKRKKSWSEDSLITGANRIRDALRAIAYGFSVKGKIGIPMFSEAEVNLSPKDMIQRYQDLTKDTVLSRSLYFDAFEELSKCVGDGKAPRIVVFVDDLDRCFPDKAVALLEGIKLVLHQPGFSFVLGVNEAITHAFIKTKYEKEFQIRGSFFDDYLDKIVQVKIPVPKRESGDMGDYIQNLLDEAGIFVDGTGKSDTQKDAIPLIAQACKNNPRSIVRLLNRIHVTTRIGSMEKCEYDPLALLIHIATDEVRFAGFRESIELTVIIEKKDEKLTEVRIGQFLSNEMEQYKNHGDWITRLRDTKLKSRQDKLDSIIETLDKNPHLCKLLNSEKGREWLSNEELRRTLGEASKSTLGEKKSETETPETVSSPFENSIRELERNMVEIPQGEFDMGSNEDDSEKPIRRVKLKAFQMGAMQVTQAQYETVMGKNPSSFKGHDNPVETVSWDQAKELCEKLSEKTGKKFGLPSEAQWEYACRAGSKGRYCIGDEESGLSDYAWYSENSGGKTHLVGRKKPNSWGLYDMHGNVWEWCEDHWHDNYNGAPDDGSAWLDKGEGALRVMRGGSWNGGAEDCRTAFRDGRIPPLAFSWVGRKQENLPGLVDGGNRSAVPVGFPLFSFPCTARIMPRIVNTLGVKTPAKIPSLGAVRSLYYRPFKRLLVIDIKMNWQ